MSRRQASPGNRQRRAARARTATLTLVLAALALVASPHLGAAGAGLHGAAHAAEEQTGANPHANFWGAVREGVSGTTTVQGQERGVLIQNSGQNWREVRNGPVASISPYVFAAVVALIGLFFVIWGRDRLEETPSGETVRRWSLFDRLLHWYTAILFLILAITGFSLLFGRAVLIPVLGLYGFGAYAGWAKVLHNYCGPLFLAGVLLEIAVWIRYNIPRRYDWAWFKNLGGLIGGSSPHVGRVNAGQKAWFWAVVGFGLAVGASGVIMDFPLFGQTRFVMQVSNVVHSVLATLFVSFSFVHMYMGTLGTEGAFEGMWSGTVSGAFARQHHDLWYEKLVEKGAAGKPSS